MAIGRDVTDALANFDLPVLTNSVCQHVAFVESATKGSTVLELEPESSAAGEIKQLTSELLSFVSKKDTMTKDRQ